MFDPKLWPDMAWMIIGAMILIGYLAAGLFALIDSIATTWIRARYGLPAGGAAAEPDDDEPDDLDELPEPGPAKQDGTVTGPNPDHGDGPLTPSVSR